MKHSRTLHAALCCCVLLPAACDAPSKESKSTPTQQTKLHMPVQHAELPATTHTPVVSIPTNEAEHAAAIQHLTKHPRTDAVYAEQVKLLTESYLKQYSTPARGRQAAMECFMSAILAQPERFSGKDFDRAYEFCDYPATGEPTPYLHLLKAELSMADYRRTADEKTACLNTVKEATHHADTATRAYAFYIAACYTQGAEQAEWAKRYFKEADATGCPYRLPLLYRADLPTQQVIQILEEVAAHGTQAPALIPFIKRLSEDTATAQQLSNSQNLRPLYLAVQLEALLNRESAPRAELDTLARELQAATPAGSYTYADKVLAQYLHATGQHAAAVETCRSILSTQPEAEDIQLLLADALAATQQGTAEAETLYRKLATAPAPHTMQQALQGLLQLQEKQQRYTEALQTTEDILKAAPSPACRVSTLFKRAELAEQIGNLTEAISLYSMLETDYSATPEIALPACKKLLQLLTMRQFKASTNKEKGTFSPSDKWYAWSRGRDFVNGMRRNTEQLDQLTPEQKKLFEEICKMVDELGIDYEVLTEERDQGQRYR
ncbi:MAG: hypothetical protein IJY53_09690 [Akkermansia sp.]|nr:hypothetical protein [Akkermansia sp.]